MPLGAELPPLVLCSDCLPIIIEPLAEPNAGVSPRWLLDPGRSEKCPLRALTPGSWLCFCRLIDCWNVT